MNQQCFIDDQAVSKAGLLGFLSMLLLLTLLGACSESTNTLPQASPILEGDQRQVVLIAVDGLDPNLLERFARAGRLPNISQLIRQGSLAKIDCVVGTISPVVWTTVATGVSPARHGIPDFVAEGQLVTSSLRQVPAFWNILPRYGLKPATLGWMVTWPAEPDSGLMVSDRAYWGTFENKQHPDELLDLSRYTFTGSIEPGELTRFTSHAYNAGFESGSERDPGYAVDYLIKHRLITPFARDRIHTRMAIEILQEHDPDLLALYYRGIDYVSHGFWQYFEPQPFREAGWAVDPEDVANLKDIIPEYYTFLDEQVGEVVASVDSDALIVLLSDHGFGTALGDYRLEQGNFLSGNHRSQGVLILSGPSVRKNQEQTAKITHFEILPTILAALNLPIARDLEGYPLLSYFTDEALSSRNLLFVDSHGLRESSPATTSAEDDEIMENLRSLGYVK